MPIPRVRNNENKSDYMARCMSDKSMQEYDQKQRTAICIQNYKEAKKEKIIKGLEKLEKNFSGFIALLERDQLTKALLTEIPSKDLDRYSEEGKMLYKTIYLKNRMDKNTIEKSAEIANSYTLRNDKAGKTKVNLLEDIQKQLNKMVEKKKNDTGKNDNMEDDKDEDNEPNKESIQPIGSPLDEVINLNQRLGK